VIREVREELDIGIVDPEKVGEFTFRFGNENPRLVHVFRTDDIDGTPKESEEAIPRWYPQDDLPYDRMWETFDPSVAWLRDAVEEAGF
jgi:8-oxo-dGTP diphosphatase